ncbi:MAG TPA: flavin reductase family protein [Dehalococcoidia bacterium]|nr:flavin reductase family protein [Dehalococcoidia bacterium]
MVEASEFRDALKDFPSGVTIITTADQEGAPLGATVSAFTSLSLDPPLVLICLKDTGKTTKAIRERRAFAVHFLDASQTTLARRFADDMANKFENAAHTLNAAGVPCLDDCPLRLECTLHAEYAGGDHIILIGRVESARRLNEFEPLVFARRSFFSLGSQLVEA